MKKNITIKLIKSIPHNGSREKMITLVKQNKDIPTMILKTSHKELNIISDHFYDIDHRHWHGIQHMCESKKPLIRCLINQQAPNRVICAKCDIKGCNYQQQYTDLPSLVLAVPPYINTEYPERHQTQRFIMDECVFDKFKAVPLEKIAEHLNQASKDGLIDGTFTRDVLFDNPDLLIKLYGMFLNNLKAYLENFDLEDKILPLFNFDISQLLYQGKSIKTFGREAQEVYYLEALLWRYPDAEIILHDPYASEDMIDEILKLVEEKTGKKINLEVIKVIQPYNSQNEVYQISDYGDITLKYPCSTLNRLETRLRISRNIQLYLDKEYTPDVKIGLLTFMKHIYKEKKFHPEIYIPSKYKNVCCAYFGGDYKSLGDVDVLIIVGTYLVNDESARKSHDALNGVDSVMGAFKEGFFYEYIDEGFNRYFHNLQESIWYKIFHSAKPAAHPVKILAFSFVPKRIRDEFQFQYMRFDENGFHILKDTVEEQFLDYMREVGRVSRKDAIRWLGKTFPFLGQTYSNLNNRVKRMVERFDELCFVVGESDRGRPPSYIVYKHDSELLSQS